MEDIFCSGFKLKMLFYKPLSNFKNVGVIKDISQNCALTSFVVLLSLVAQTR